MYMVHVWLKERDEVPGQRDIKIWYNRCYYSPPDHPTVGDVYPIQRDHMFNSKTFKARGYSSEYKCINES